MDFLKKNKIIIAIVVIVLVLGGGYLFMSRSSKIEPITPGDQTQNVKKLTPADIGLTLELKADKKAVIMTLTKLDGIKSIEYEVSYNAKSTEATGGDEGETGDIPRGVVASPIEVEGQSKITKEILLGTCSRNVCKYDQVTSDIKFIIKVDFTNGEVGSVEASVPLDE